MSRGFAPSRARASQVLLVVLGGYVLVRPSADALVTFSLGPSVTALLLLALLGAIGLWWAVTMPHRSDGRSIPLASWVALFFIATLFGSALTSVDPGSALETAMRMSLPALVFVAAHQIGYVNDDAFAWLGRATIAGLVVPSLIASGQLAGVVSWYPLAPEDAEQFGWIDRVPGPYASPGLLGVSLMIVILALLGDLALARSADSALVQAGVIAAAGALLVANQTRGAVLGLGLGLAVLLVLYRRFAWLGAIAASGVAALFVLPPSFLRIDELSSQSGEDSTVDYRIELWQSLFPRFWENPLLGAGPGRAKTWNADGLPPHNAMIRMLVEVGAIGALAYMLLIAAVGVALVRAWRGAVLERDRAVAATCLSLGAAYLVVGLSENTLTTVIWSVPVFGLLGAALGSLEARAGAEAGADAAGDDAAGVGSSADAASDESTVVAVPSS